MAAAEIQSITITNQDGIANPISTSSSSCCSTNTVLDWAVKDLSLNSSNNVFSGSSNDENDDEEQDSVLCTSGSRLITTGLSELNSTENVLKFVNAGGEAVEEAGDSSIHIMSDSDFEGGDILRTSEVMLNGGKFASLYQSARVGNFCYRFGSISTGDYLVDLHFAEIVNTNGPRGMRTFNIFMQEEKVVSELDIYAIVGANRPLQLVDNRITVGNSEEIVIRFQGVHGSPIVSGICIKEAPHLPVPEETQACLICQSCASQTEVASVQNKHLREKSTAKYEKTIQELNTLCQRKTDECYQAWMSLTALNKQLEEVSMELHNKSFQNICLDQAMVVEAAKLREVSGKYECAKNWWTAAINELGRKFEILKQDHFQLAHEARECANSIPDLHKMVSAVRGLVAQCDDLKLKYNEEQVKRKKLYNQIQESKGNIRVFCRCRPPSKEEVSTSYATVVNFDAAKDGELGVLTGGSTKKIYKFDRVYTPKDDQVDVYADASPVVISVLDGYNVCIFAYGQTGTGKTYTMEGYEHNRGVNYRTLEQLFKVVEERKNIFTYNISISVLEVYNEQIRDLLATSPTSKKLEVRQAYEGVHHVPGIVEAKVENIGEVWDALQVGSNARVVESNNVNEHSSRSHCMICIMVRAKNLMTGECTKSKLWLVDLAGSERLAKTDVQGERLKEAQHINRSLSALGDVISALAVKSSHIPYRNSKLTHLLQDSLGGDSKTLMFVQISPSEQDMGETVSSLNFATRVRGVELGPAKKQVDNGELQKLKLLLDKVKQESRSKDEALLKLEESFQSLEGKAKSKDQFSRNQQEKVNELEVQLDAKTELCRQLEKQLLQMSNEVKEKDKNCLSLQQKVNGLENKLKEHQHVDSKTLQHKVKDLESKLKDRAEQFELQSMTFHEKIKELEEKLRQQDQQPEWLPSLSSERLKVTPRERKGWSTAETPFDTNSTHGRSSLKPSNFPDSQGDSILLKGTESLRDLRRKHDLQSRGIENSFLFAASLSEKVQPTGQSNKVRHIDPSKAFARITKSTRPLSNAQRGPISSGRINREHVPGIKVKDNITRVWSR